MSVWSARHLLHRGVVPRQSLVFGVLAVLGTCAGLLAGCGGEAVKAGGPVPTGSPLASSQPAASPSVIAVSTPSVPASTAPATSRPAGLPPFTATVTTLTAADLPHTYRAGCPTPPSQLRALHLAYVDFSGVAHIGTLIINVSAVPTMEKVFADLYAHHFPIREMVPVDVYDGSDNASTAADNTAGFNCRLAVTTGPASWSEHAYGEAVDVDPVENPYIEGATVIPIDGKAFANRSDVRAGMAVAGGVLVEAFERNGWYWGVTFDDYQHFSVNGK